MPEYTIVYYEKSTGGTLWHPLIPRIESAEVGSKPLAYLIRPGSDFRGDRIRCDTGEKPGRPGSIHHVSGREVDVGVMARYSNINVLNLKVSSLAVKTSSFHHAKVWSPKTR